MSTTRFALMIPWHAVLRGVWLIRCSGFNLWSSMSCADCQKVEYVQRSLVVLLLLFCI